MIDLKGKICPFCKSGFSGDDKVVVCTICENPHHLDCWRENMGCTTFGCTGVIAGVFDANGEPLTENTVRPPEPNKTFEPFVTPDVAPSAAGVQGAVPTPAFGAPAGQTPVYGAPVGQAPVYGAPAGQAPFGIGQAPAYGSPAGQAPAYGAPAGQAPFGMGQAPAYGTPAGQAPAYGAPVGRSPVYGAPAGQTPTGPSAPAQAPRFCRECGKMLPPNAAFCTNCGTRVAPMPAAPVFTTPAVSEPVAPAVLITPDEPEAPVFPEASAEEPVAEIEEVSVIEEFVSEEVPVEPEAPVFPEVSSEEPVPEIEEISVIEEEVSSDVPAEPELQSDALDSAPAEIVEKAFEPEAFAADDDGFDSVVVSEILSFIHGNGSSAEETAAPLDGDVSDAQSAASDSGDFVMPERPVIPTPPVVEGVTSFGEDTIFGAEPILDGVPSEDVFVDIDIQETPVIDDVPAEELVPEVEEISVIEEEIPVEEPVAEEISSEPVQEDKPFPFLINVARNLYDGEIALCPALRHAFIDIEEEDWVLADIQIEKAMLTDPENPYCYLAKLMSGLHASSTDALKEHSEEIASSIYYEKILEFGTSSLKKAIKKYCAKK